MSRPQLPKITRMQRGRRLVGTLNRLTQEQRKADYAPMPDIITERQFEFIAEIVSSGPLGQPDFIDSRYWFRTPGRLTFDPIQGNHFWAPHSEGFSGLYDVAVNINETFTQTHEVAPGTLVVVREMQDSDGAQLYVFTPGGGSGGGTKEVVIACAIDSPADEAVCGQQTTFANFGPHLRCFEVLPIAGPGPQIGNEPLVVYPPVFNHYWINGQPTVAEFKKPDGSQIYTIGTSPSFTIVNTARGWMLDFGTGEAWVPAPAEEDICGAPVPEPVGACCDDADGSCTDGLTIAQCSAPGLTYQGDGVQCVDITCPQPVGACCDQVTGACSEIEQSACTGPDETWLGPGTTCAVDCQ